MNPPDAGYQDKQSVATLLVLVLEGDMGRRTEGVWGKGATGTYGRPDFRKARGETPLMSLKTFHM